MTSEAATPAESLIRAYEQKAARYYSNARTDFVRQLPADPTASVLEVGCGTGATGALALARRRAGRYVGIELMEAAAREAREVLTDVYVGDVEKMTLDFQPASFDALLLSEVLEHLVEPDATLRRLARFLRPGGTVLASSPNVSHWRVVRELLNGRFDLADQGVFDRTHLRWFTPRSFVRMFHEAGFVIESAGPVTPFSARTRLVTHLTGHRFDHLFMTQIALRGVKR
ncbi:MAG: class I SAM-dependent methyltransferase [Hyphomicrobium sp.]|nr:class I SAM-dependent methyltransferase [Hyphomicrobium sp.]